MDNIYSTVTAEILAIKFHTESERSFLLDFKTENKPGKFVMVSIPGIGEVPISISSFIKEGIELTIRNTGIVTAAIFKTEQGDKLHVRGPYGNSFPVNNFYGKHLIIIAGGSGVAAVKSLIEYFYKPDECTLGKLDILIGFRSPKHILFEKTVKEWTKHCNVMLTVDSNDDPGNEWHGKIGFVTQYIGSIEELDRETSCVVVGPPRMMSNTVKELLSKGILPENIWLSFERHMKCGVGKCGHCRIRDKYVCVDGPVFNYIEASELFD